MRHFFGARAAACRDDERDSPFGRRMTVNINTTRVYASRADISLPRQAKSTAHSICFNLKMMPAIVIAARQIRAKSKISASHDHDSGH